MAIRRGYVDTRIGQIHHRSAGTDPGTPLVLLHQTASSSAMYERVMRLLDGHYRLFALDTPGFGQSDFPPPQPSVHDYATTLLEALTNLGVPRFHLFGHHTGASIACDMAATAPERVANLILCGPPYLQAEERAQWRAKVAPMVIQPDGSHVLQIWKRNHDVDPNTSAEVLHRETIDNLRAGERWHEAYQAVFHQDMPALLAQVRCPILLLCGPGDLLFPYFHAAARARPDAKAVTIDKGSYVLDDDPARVAAEIRAFLTEAGAA